MINSVYLLVNKGSWRALSFILAILLTASFFFNIHQFASELRTANPIWVVLILWSTVILWIHGMGFDIRSNLGKYLFFPIFGYLISFVALFQHFLY